MLTVLYAIRRLLITDPFFIASTFDATIILDVFFSKEGFAVTQFDMTVDMITAKEKRINF